MTNRIPSNYVGVWKRSKLRRGASPWDLTTRVFWLQTPYWHADIRIPADRPDFSGVCSLKECSPEQLQALLQQEAFCGFTTVEDDVCRWLRQIDYRLRETDDFGQMRFTGNDVEEIGIATDYYELWHKLPDSVGQSFALERIQNSGDEHQQAYLCVAGGYFIYSRNRGMWTSPAVRARRKIEGGTASRAEIEAFVDFESSFGTIEEGIGRIEMSTLPWREGEIAFDLNDLAMEIASVPSATVRKGWRLIPGSGEFPLSNVRAA
ncbi:hypothetical protein GNZ12_31620 [Paraburkholderia sp. 1N]|uniref:Uncharacterized protein n=1 Tax=Paraburkholderia solitsugae TaxID=2675748 RepID=A0ABX2C0Y7_9BURK|nr:hypothetical protein [Paraburkholderia solitsugae]NPT45790.1 hypothetical protein [Paraburkholderia solitsugae]